MLNQPSVLPPNRHTAHVVRTALLQSSSDAPVAFISSNPFRSLSVHFCVVGSSSRRLFCRCFLETLSLVSCKLKPGTGCLSFFSVPRAECSRAVKYGKSFAQALLMASSSKHSGCNVETVISFPYWSGLQVRVWHSHSSTWPRQARAEPCS